MTRVSPPGRSFEAKGDFGPREMVATPLNGVQNPAYRTSHVPFDPFRTAGSGVSQERSRHDHHNI